MTGVQTCALPILMIARQDQAECREPFGWQRLPNVEAEGWIVGKLFELFVASHDGYTRLANPVVHRRFVFSLRSEFWVVRDLALGVGECQLDLFWHLAPGLQPSTTHTDYFSDENGGIQIMTAPHGNWMRTVERHPHSPVYGNRETHSALHLATTSQLPVELLTVLQPVRKGETLQRSLGFISSSKANSVSAYRYQSGDTEHLIIFGQGRSWSLEDCSSDAGFLYSRTTPNGRLLICCHATYVEWNGHRMIAAAKPELRVEVMGGDDPELISPDPETVTIDREAWRMFSGLNPQIALKIT